MKFLLILACCLFCSMPVLADETVPHEYLYGTECVQKQEKAEFDFLVHLLKVGQPTQANYYTIYKLVRRYQSGYFASVKMVIYVLPNTLYVQFADGTDFGVDRRLGKCLIPKEQASPKGQLVFFYALTVKRYFHRL